MLHPILAGILSFLIPGLGQAIAGDIKKGVIFFIVAIIISLIASLIFRSWIVRIVDVGYRLFTAYDAYLMAQN